MWICSGSNLLIGGSAQRFCRSRPACRKLRVANSYEEAKPMPGLVSPHGRGSLKPLMPTGGLLDAERARAQALRPVRVSSREKGDLIMLGIGGFTPLDGFMTHADWEGVCDRYCTASGLFWAVSITFVVSGET